MEAEFGQQIDYATFVYIWQELRKIPVGPNRHITRVKSFVIYDAVTIIDRA